jgi:hypothetical protein
MKHRQIALRCPVDQRPYMYFAPGAKKAKDRTHSCLVMQVRIKPDPIPDHPTVLA